MNDSFEYVMEKGNNRPKFPGFYYLMLNKIQDILVVSNPYDAFILEEDRSLSEQLTADYLDLSLSAAPRIVHASSGAEALSMLEKHCYGLVITMTRIVDMNPFTFGRQAKKLCRDIPVILMAYDTVEVNCFLERSKKEKGIDKIFVWSGDSAILMAIVKYIEDKLNVEHDAIKGFTRVIVVVEDSPRYYSFFLPIFYQEIMKQTRDLVFHSLSEKEKKLRRRSRPKVLLASTLEEALEYYERYRDNVLAVISDMEYPVDGKKDKYAGLKLIKKVKSDDPHLACLIQSSEIDNRELANREGAFFIHKHSDGFEQQLQSFITQNMGFGEFIFRTKSGRMVDRAANIIELREKLKTIPDESLIFHSEKDHFSNWFMARSEFRLAAEIKPKKIADFKSTDEVREHLIKVIGKYIDERRHGVILNYKDSGFSKDAYFVRYAEGSIGGKARGIAFIDALLVKNKIHEKYPNIKFGIPRTFVISCDLFDRFMEENDLIEAAFEENDNNEILNMFLGASLPVELVNILIDYLNTYSFPIAVRSSSLLEDAYYQPLAGIYSTYMLPNSHKDINYRLNQLIKAIKSIYASVFLQNSKSYHKSTTDRLTEEKMGIIIQELVGRFYGDYFYPCISGVAQTYNFYPIPPQKTEDGVVQIGLGFGKIVVEGGKVVRFSPKNPGITMNNYSVDALLENSQSEFYALKVNEKVSIKIHEKDNLVKLGLDKAEEHGTLFPAGSVYVAADGVVRDSLYYKGPRIVTFANVLKHGLFPLGEILNDFLEIGKYGMGGPVEIEFAVNIDDPKKNGIEFYFLQIRPLVTHHEEVAVDFEGIDFSKVVCSTNRGLGNGMLEDIWDIILVKPEDFDPSRTREIASQIGEINRELLEKNRKYILIGPGRWGSSDPWLGIPVKWEEISSVGVVVEMTLKNFNIDPSQGTHFFHNIISLGIGYFTIKESEFNEYINWGLLDRQKIVKETNFLRHIRFEKPLLVKMNGKSGKAMIVCD